MSHLFRELHDGEDITDIIARYIAALAIAAALGVLLIAGWSMYREATPAAAELYRMELLQQQADPDWQAEQRRLRKKHGDRVIIYERGQEPYYVDQTGKRCRYI